MPQVEINGVNLFYERHGEGEKILFLHDWSMGLALWRYQIAEMSDFYDVTALDFRGHGRSGKPEGDYSLETLTDDLESFIRSQSLEGAILVGWFMGGMVALNYLSRRPREAKALVLVGTSPKLQSPDDYSLSIEPRISAEVLLEQFEREDPDFMENYIVSLFHKMPTEGTIEWVRREAEMTPHRVRAAAREAMRGADLRPALGGIRVPTLILHGRHDTFAPFEAAEYMARHIPGARLIEFRNSGHTPHLEDLDPFSEALAQFITPARAL